MTGTSRLLCSVVLAASMLVGCTTSKRTDTTRTGMEQLLISNAIDQTLDTVDFSPLQSQRVYLDPSYLDGVDNKYLLGSLRHRIAMAGATVAAKAEEADVVLEVRSGGIGTDTTNSFVGVPEIVLPGMLTLPEVRLVTRDQQTGTAKIGLAAYDAKTKRILGNGGVKLAKSNDTNWSVLGAGPFKTGSVHSEIEQRTQGQAGWGGALPSQIVFTPPRPTVDGAQPEKLQLTGGEK